jgi:hypothetical protein
MLRIEPRLAFINGVLLANRVLIFRFQLLAVYVLLVHNCGECRRCPFSKFFEHIFCSKFFEKLASKNSKKKNDYFFKLICNLLK